MQAEKGFENLTMLKTISKIVKTDGIKGLYRGFIPPLW
jgi:solute carrier family 25 (mitochondrial carnitine/acylcarnitine transporter), member 20/29